MVLAESITAHFFSDLILGFSVKQAYFQARFAQSFGG
jgi:hypothetical protein